MDIGIKFSNDELNIKVLRSLTKSWQPKVMAISEKKSLSKMSLTALLGKLQEDELELGRLEKHEEQEEKTKSISLRLESKEAMQDDYLDQDENITLLVKKFGNFLQKYKAVRFGKGRKLFKKKKASTSNQNFTCF